MEEADGTFEAVKNSSLLQMPSDVEDLSMTRRDLPFVLVDGRPRSLKDLRLGRPHVVDVRPVKVHFFRNMWKPGVVIGMAVEKQAVSLSSRQLSGELGTPWRRRMGTGWVGQEKC